MGKADTSEHSRLSCKSELHHLLEKPFPHWVPAPLPHLSSILQRIRYNSFKAARNLDCKNKRWLCCTTFNFLNWLLFAQRLLPLIKHLVRTSFFTFSPFNKQENQGSQRSGKPGHTAREGESEELEPNHPNSKSALMTIRCLCSSSLSLSSLVYLHGVRNVQVCITHRLTTERVLYPLILKIPLWYILQMRALGCPYLPMAPQQVAKLGCKPTSNQTKALHLLHGSCYTQSFSAPLLWSCLSFPQTALPPLCADRSQ